MFIVSYQRFYKAALLPDTLNVSKVCLKLGYWQDNPKNHDQLLIYFKNYKDLIEFNWVAVSILND